MSRRHKFILQWILALATGFFIYRYLGIQFIHIPLLDKTINLGLWYIPFSALIIVTFTNAYNITDGLDGLAGGLLMLCLIAFGVIAAGSLDTPSSIGTAGWWRALIAVGSCDVYPARIF